MRATTIESVPMQGAIKDTTPLNPDDRLVLAAQADRQYFAALYEKYFDQVARFIYQRIGAKEEALDMTQQVFMQAMMALDKYESRGFPFSSWLYRIALNEIHSSYRKSKNQRYINIDDESLQQMIGEINEAASEEREEALIMAMHELNEEEILLIEMRFFEKRPFKEMAEIRDMSESAVKMQIYRLLDELKSLMSKERL